MRVVYLGDEPRKHLGAGSGEVRWEGGQGGQCLASHQPVTTVVNGVNDLG